jgi:glutathione synthase/RimK-type ligase-like ATP-grasp enzyme
MKILIVATDVWPTAARISIALAQIGFHVAAISPAGSLVRTIKAVTNHYTYGAWEGSGSIAAAIRAWQPDLLVCTDDQAVKHLHDLHAIASKDVDSRSLLQLIETSLGNPTWFLAAEQKSMFMTIAGEAGVRCPRTWVIADDRHAPLPSRVPYPILVKADGTCGGKGVRVVANEHQARDAITELSLPISWPDRIKRPIAKSIGISRINRRRQRTVCLQEQVPGRPANRAVACHEGSVLAGVSVEALETQHELGPASIVRVIEHPEMTAIAKTMVERLQLSGFVGFDFMLDPKNNAWLIEMNPRVTPICHLHLADGTSLPAAIFSKMTGQGAAPRPPIVSADTVVLFPGGLWQSNRSCRLSSVYLSSYHDVPWDEPELIRACINYKPSNGFRRHASKLLGIV